MQPKDLCRSNLKQNMNGVEIWNDDTHDITTVIERQRERERERERES